MITMMSRYAVFCAVVEHGSFTAAAAALNYSQSAVSQAVKALEQELGATLISRETRRLTLTRDGEGYLPEPTFYSWRTARSASARSPVSAVLTFRSASRPSPRSIPVCAS